MQKQCINEFKQEQVQKKTVCAVYTHDVVEWLQTQLERSNDSASNSSTGRAFQAGMVLGKRRTCRHLQTAEDAGIAENDLELLAGAGHMCVNDMPNMQHSRALWRFEYNCWLLRYEHCYQTELWCFISSHTLDSAWQTSHCLCCEVMLSILRFFTGWYFEVDAITAGPVTLIRLKFFLENLAD